MKQIALVFFLFLMSCAELPQREPATLETVMAHELGEPDLAKSSIKLFPPEKYGDSFHYYFYLQLKNEEGKYVDVDESLLNIQNKKKENQSFTLERLNVGRYYLTLVQPKKITLKHLKFYVNQMQLKDEFHLPVSFPDSKNSKIILMEKEDHKLKLRLVLSDKKGHPVELGSIPEILFEGEGTISTPEKVTDGNWEFSVIYPEQNQIFYISVRSQGVYLERLFRYHHVEK